MDYHPKSFQYITNKCYVYINFLDKQITRNLIQSNIETRPAKRNGLWCCTLLPTVLICYNIMHKVSPTYSLVTYTAFGLLFYCFLFVVFMSISCNILKELVYGGYIASTLVSTLLIYTVMRKDLMFSLLFSLPIMFMFNFLLNKCLVRFPRTFTVGEAMVTSQSIVLYAAMTMTKVILNFKSDEETEFIHGIVFTVLSTVGIIVTAVCVMKDEQRNLEYLGNVFAVATLYALTVLHVIVGGNIQCLPNIIHYVFWSKNRPHLITFWLFLLVIAIAVISMRTQLAVKASTVTRKSFHILASIVFLTGYVYDRSLMMLASGIGLGALVLVEGVLADQTAAAAIALYKSAFMTLRKSGIEPISSVLQSAFVVYSDEKDCGAFAMTPLYLFCGLACPLLLAPGGDLLELLSGVLAIGVGDTAASWFGTKYGHNKWTGTEKSMEGTTFNILSQLMTVYALQLFDLVNIRHALVRTAFAATASALVEAKTEQVDNLVLPLVTLFSFQVTNFLS